MTVVWIVFAISVSVLLGLCGLLAELLFRRWGRSTRGVWATVLALSGLLPLAMLAWRPVLLDAWTRSNLWVSSLTGLPLDELRLFLGRLQVLLDRALPDLTTFLIGGWAVAAIIFVAWLVRSWWDLYSRRNDWEPGEFHGLNCLYTDQTGPGLFGFVRARLVIPRWVRGLEETQQAMIAAHEAEHQRHRDPWLNTFGNLILLAAPWNPVLWWQRRRLRLAVEVDCDDRAAERFGNSASYATALVEIAERQVRWLTPFSQDEDHLVSRIHHLMGARRPGWLGTLTAGIGLLAVLLLIWAAPLPVSTQPHPSEVQVQKDVIHTGTPYTTPPRCQNCPETADLPTPDVLDRPKGVEELPDRLAVPVYIERDGSVGGVVCRPFCMAAYEQRLFEALRTRRYSPSRIWGISVASWQSIKVDVPQSVR